MTTTTSDPLPFRAAPPGDQAADKAAGAPAATDHLIAPHGGELVDLLVGPERAAELRAASREWPSWDLTPRQLCDLELILNGGFSPLSGFMNRSEFESVAETMRLADGTLWPMPITLDVTEEVAAGLGDGSRLALRDPEGVMLAVLQDRKSVV